MGLKGETLTHPSPSPAYRTVCSVNGPLVVLDQVKVRRFSLSPGSQAIPRISFKN